MRILLSTVTSKLAYAGQPGMRAKLTLLLQYAARGVRVNPTAGPKQVRALVRAGWAGAGGPGGPGGASKRGMGA